MYERAYEVASHFLLAQGEKHIAPYGNGHINDTFCVSVETGAARPVRYILQKVNRYVFPDPEGVIENIERVTAYLRGVIESEGGDPTRETLTLVESADGGHSYTDADNQLWRVYLFIEDTISRDLPDTPELFALSGAAFGRFQRQLGGFDASTLHESIHDFHNTPARYRQLEDAVRRNDAGRLGEVGPELAFCMERGEETGTLLRALAAGEIPLRVTHNDTKLNNILFDSRTNEGLCVIDLDTVMPGLTAYDFGDAIRVGGNTADEGDPDISHVSISIPNFTAFARGFLSAVHGVITDEETASLVMGAKLMTWECASRFLADYLNGDVYFKIHYPTQNLDRARNQIALVQDIDRHQAQLEAIIESVLREVRGGKD